MKERYGLTDVSGLCGPLCTETDGFPSATQKQDVSRQHSVDVFLLFLGPALLTVASVL